MAISIDKCREILGKSGDGMSNEEIEHLQNIFVLLSDFAITSYLEKRKYKRDGERYENEQAQPEERN